MLTANSVCHIKTKNLAVVECEKCGEAFLYAPLSKTQLKNYLTRDRLKKLRDRKEVAE
jgi:hypothetical protein